MRQIKKKDISALHAILKGAKMTKGDTAGKLALVKAIIATKAEAVSIHAPTEGATRVLGVDRKTLRFQSTLPRRERRRGVI